MTLPSRKQPESGPFNLQPAEDPAQRHIILIDYNKQIQGVTLFIDVKTDPN